MSDVYGHTVRKLKGENDPAVTFQIWVLVTQICAASRNSANNLHSGKIMEFLRKSPPPRQLLADLKRFRLTHRQDHNTTVMYVNRILEE